FIHAPLKDNIKQEERNGSSIVFQARFNVDDQNDACLAFWGGDAGWKIWEQILNKSNDNDLAWDLFLAPHHCSWTFFNDNTDEGKKKPQDSSLQILDKKREGNPKVISSSKEIKNDKNPPSVKAKNQYVNKVKDKNFWVTSEHSNTNPPEPIEFEITNQGPDETISNNSKNSQKEKLIGGAAGSPKTYG
ncbi:MAG: cobyric acid synthase CobQ, partial [bacterium]